MQAHEQGTLDVVHFFFVGSVIKDLLESDGVGGFVEELLEALPNGFQFKGTLRIVQCGRIENSAMDATNDFAKGDIGRRFCEEVATFLAALAFDDLLGFKFDKNLNQIVGRNALLFRQVIDSHGFTTLIMAGEAEDSPDCIIAFDG
jgi:hypothetical protein